MKIYEALYCSMTEESSFATISLHRTRAGAEKAVAKSKSAARKYFSDTKKRFKNEGVLMFGGKWDSFKAWDIQETELLD